MVMMQWAVRRLRPVHRSRHRPGRARAARRPGGRAGWPRPSASWRADQARPSVAVGQAYGRAVGGDAPGIAFNAQAATVAAQIVAFP